MATNTNSTIRWLRDNYEENPSFDVRGTDLFAKFQSFGKISATTLGMCVLKTFQNVKKIRVRNPEHWRLPKITVYQGLREKPASTPSPSVPFSALPSHFTPPYFVLHADHDEIKAGKDTGMTANGNPVLMILRLAADGKADVSVSGRVINNYVFPGTGNVPNYVTFNEENIRALLSAMNSVRWCLGIDVHSAKRKENTHMNSLGEQVTFAQRCTKAVPTMSYKDKPRCAPCKWLVSKQRESHDTLEPSDGPSSCNTVGLRSRLAILLVCKDLNNP